MLLLTIPKVQQTRDSDLYLSALPQEPGGTVYLLASQPTSGLAFILHTKPAGLIPAPV